MTPSPHRTGYLPLFSFAGFRNTNIVICLVYFGLKEKGSAFWYSPAKCSTKPNRAACQSYVGASYPKGAAAGDGSPLWNFMALPSISIPRSSECLKKRKSSINCHLIMQKEKKRKKKKQIRGKKVKLSIMTSMQTKHCQYLCWTARTFRSHTSTVHE